MRSLFLIEQAWQLMLMPRSHKKNLWTAYDTIASHSFHVAIIALVLAKMEWLSDTDAHRCAVTGLMHDLAEARTGDHDFIAKNYNKCNEEQAIADQFSDLWFDNTFTEQIQEYEIRNSQRSKILKDADHLAQIYHERSLMRQWNKLAEQRYTIDKEKRIPNLFTQSAKDICKRMETSNPNERRRDEFIIKHYNPKNLVWSK